MSQSERCISLQAPGGIGIFFWGSISIAVQKAGNASTCIDGRSGGGFVTLPDGKAVALGVQELGKPAHARDGRLGQEHLPA